MIFDTKPFSIPLTTIFMIVLLLASTILAASDSIIDINGLWLGVAVMTIPLIISAIILPYLKIRFMASSWKQPKHTFFCSRPLLRLIGSAMIGQSLAMALLALYQGGVWLVMLMGTAPATIAFLISTSRRLQRNPRSEFAIPPLRFQFSRLMS